MKKKSNTGSKVYRVFSVIVITLLAIGFAFPLYWIITGSFKTSMAINAPTPQWWPQEWVSANYQKLFSRQTAPLWEIGIPFTGKSFAGPVVPAAIRWLLNTIFMAVVSMLLTCFTAAMAGYALAKKRFIGRSVVFTLIVCAMALPKQVILIPLLREMSSLHLYNTIWAVILPIVGWPFGVFLIKQFGEGIPGEMMEAAKIDGASNTRVMFSIVIPLLKPIIVFTIVQSSIGMFNLFTEPFILTNSSWTGGVNNGGLTLMMYLLNKAPQGGNSYGYASACAYVITIMIVVISIFVNKFSEEKETGRRKYGK